jgi:hypothetical protein
MAPNTGSIGQDRNAQISARLRERANQLREEIRATLARSNDENHLRVAERLAMKATIRFQISSRT